MTSYIHVFTSLGNSKASSVFEDQYLRPALLSSNPNPKYLSNISNPKPKYLTSNPNPRAGRFYILPKIHKQGNPGRPLISSNGHPTERISEFVDYHL